MENNYEQKCDNSDKYLRVAYWTMKDAAQKM